MISAFGIPPAYDRVTFDIFVHDEEVHSFDMYLASVAVLYQEKTFAEIFVGDIGMEIFLHLGSENEPHVARQRGVLLTGIQSDTFP